MSNLRHILAAALTAAFFLPVHAVDPAESQFEAVAAAAAAGRADPAGQPIEVEIDLAASPGFSVEVEGDRSVVRYPMAFNNVAEGWNWFPLANPAEEDYYHYKFLPLQSVTVERGEYEGEDKIGVTQQRKVIWRYDYFLAFENLYDFYPRSSDDDAGFAAAVPAARAGGVAMRAVARLIPPWVSESNTFWKATYGKPVDFSLKKRYLMAKLLEIRFLDRQSGEVLAVVKPAPALPVADPQR